MPYRRPQLPIVPGGILCGCLLVGLLMGGAWGLGAGGSRALQADEAPPPEIEAVVPGPAQAWKDLQQALSKEGRPAPGQLEARAREYLKAWEAAQQTCSNEDHHALGLLLNAAGRRDEASVAFAHSAACAALPDVVRATSASAFASNAVAAAQAGRLTGEPLAALVKQVEEWASLASGSSAGALRMALGQLHGLVGATDAALEDYALAAEGQPSLTLQAASQAVRLLVESASELERLPAARAKLASLRARLETAQKHAVAQARKALAAEQDPQQVERRQSALRAAEAGFARLDQAGRPLELLGSPAPEWTLVRAYGAGSALADYRGKVVVLDFWATWCPWCIRSFPALRDLLRDYAGKDLAVVGVTTSAASVFDQRYDLDDDLKAKASGGQVRPVLQRPKRPAAASAASEASEPYASSPPAGSPPGNDPAAAEKAAQALAQYEAQLDEFRAKEQEVLAGFIKAHAMAWDVVQIDEAEPAPKYALSGWPHCVVIDRQGRVRHFKSGALLREKPEAVAAFRKVLDALLAEPAPTK